MAHASYPLTTEQPYPRRQWWAAATAAEVSRSLMARDILGERVLLYRQEDGTAVAVSGIAAPGVSAGKGAAGGTACSAAITASRSGRMAHASACRAERRAAACRPAPLSGGGARRCVWIWTGEESTADPALLPDLAAIGLDARAGQWKSTPWRRWKRAIPCCRETCST
jgi:vanillate O-demethylase monooxygenase subunit